MYTNFIFDMGNVLMDFSPDYILSEFTNNVEEIEYLKIQIFESELWRSLDNGDISFENALLKILDDVPQSKHKICREIFNHWQEYKVPRNDMLDIIKTLKRKGYGIYLCSNAASRFHSYVDHYEVFSYFDDLVISGDLHISKPDIRIYEYLLEKNRLDAKTCLFIDDLNINIKAARMCGISGYHYNGNAELFKLFLQNINIL